MSSELNASAITSEPKPGALAPAGVGRSTAATAGSAALWVRAVADLDGVMDVPRCTGLETVWWAASNRFMSRDATLREAPRLHSRWPGPDRVQAGSMPTLRSGRLSMSLKPYRAGTNLAHDASGRRRCDAARHRLC